MKNNMIEEYEIINGFAIVDNNFYIVSANESLYNFIGTHITTFHSVADLIHQVDLDDFISLCQELRVGQTEEMVLRMRRCDNAYRWVLLELTKCQHKYINGSIKEYYTLNASDIFALKKCVDAITAEENNSIHGAVADLLCEKEAVIRYCEKLISSDSKAEFAMFLMKINDLDEYEKKHGKEAADSFYNDIVTLVCEYVGRRGIVCEFAKNSICIVINGICSELNVRSFVSALRNSIAWKYQLIDDDYNISFTFGISRFPENGKDLDRVYRKMEAAMERANKKNQNCYVIYKEYLHGELEEKAVCS